MCCFENVVEKLGLGVSERLRTIGENSCKVKVLNLEKVFEGVKGLFDNVEDWVSLCVTLCQGDGADC